MEGIRHTEPSSRSAGDGLVLITDGVTDIADAAGRDDTPERAPGGLKELSDAAPAAIADQTLARLLAFADGVPQFDDITVLALRLTGLKEAPAASAGRTGRRRAKAA